MNSSAEISDQDVDKFFDSKGSDGNFAVEEVVQPEIIETKSVSPDLPKEEVQDKQNYQKTVPYEALHEERVRRQELNRELADSKKQISTLEQNFQRVLQKINQAEEKQIPKYEDDPLEALRYENNKLKEQVGHISEKDQKREEEYRNQIAEQQFLNKYREDSFQFADQTKDYKDAYKFIVKSKLDEFREAGYTQQEANELLNNDEIGIAIKAYKDGVNPAERIYKLAKARGYQPANNITTEQEFAKKPESKMERLQKGIEQSASLSSVQGKTIPNSLSLAEISQMSDEELDELIGDETKWSKMGKLMR